MAPLEIGGLGIAVSLVKLQAAECGVRYYVLEGNSAGRTRNSGHEERSKRRALAAGAGLR